MPEIRQSARAWALWAVLLAVLLPGVGERAALAKPLPPLSVLWHVDSSAREGPAVHRVAVTLAAREPFDDLRVRIRVPEGFDLSEGPTEWRGPLAGGDALTLPLVVRAPAPGTVTLELEGRTASNVHFSRTVVVHVPEPMEKPKGTEGPARPEPGPTPGIREFPSR
jgi:hypothetical protein